MDQHTMAVAYFASGCFWSKEFFFNQLKGVRETQVGFMGGHVDNPTYQQVCTKQTGHAETVKVVFNPNLLPFDKLVKYFFNLHDPTIDRSGKGGQYRSAIFYTTEAQKRLASTILGSLSSRGLHVFTELEEATTFWPAEERHQQYCSVREITPTRKSDPLFKEV